MKDDSAVMSGGPGPAPRDSAATSEQSLASGNAAGTVRVKLDGMEYEVPAALAEAWRKERDSIAGRAGAKIQALENRLAMLESELADAQPEQQQLPPGAPGAEPAAPRPPDPRNLDPASDQYDPAKYHRDNLAWQQYLVAASIEQLEARRREEQALVDEQRQRDQRWQQLVNKFYRENPELRGSEDIVDAVWRMNFNNLKDLSPDEGFAKLAELSKSRIVQLAEQGKKLSGRRTPTFETSSGARANRLREPADEGADEAPVHGGLSTIIRERQRRFRDPFSSSKSKGT